MGATSSDPYFMESLARGLSVIRAFGVERTQLSGADVAAITGLSRAAARRCLHTLTVLGYASSSNGLYELTPAVLTLGQAYLGSASLATVAQPVLDRVAAQIEEATAVAVLDGDDIVFVARTAARRILTVEVSVGSRLPAASTASGRVLLACASEQRRARFLSRVKLMRHTPHTIVDRKQLRVELDRIRADGYAIIDQELELGLRSMAVPIHRADGMAVAAINVGVQAGRVDLKTMQRELLPVLRSAAGEIGALLVHRR
jgi:IclR family transcriptional regulator, pca regulon regulatory protein